MIFSAAILLMASPMYIEKHPFKDERSISLFVAKQADTFVHHEDQFCPGNETRYVISLKLPVIGPIEDVTVNAPDCAPITRIEAIKNYLMRIPRSQFKQIKKPTWFRFSFKIVKYDEESEQPST
jgi:hypothetical protein